VGLLRPTSTGFIADANVLIDYAMTRPEILGLVAQYVGPLFVATSVLDEVEQLDELQCQAMGMIPIEASLVQLTEASQRGGPMSFEDKLCLIVARDNGWTCWSNDGPLRDACLAHQVPVVWGLELMLTLVESKHLSTVMAIEVAQKINVVNPIYINQTILNTFIEKVTTKRTKQ